MFGKVGAGFTILRDQVGVGGGLAGFGSHGGSGRTDAAQPRSEIGGRRTALVGTRSGGGRPAAGIPPEKEHRRGTGYNEHANCGGGRRAEGAALKNLKLLP